MLTHLPYCLATLVVVAASVGCSGSTITNPSGTCGTRSAEVRDGYSVPGGDDVWVPDCQNPLAREYWRVSSQDGVSAYVMPRPDGAPQLSAPCADSQHDLHPLVVRYELCSPATTTEQVEIINHIELSDALAVTHFLHTQLKFVVTEEGLGIQPFPIPADIVDACALGVNSSDLEAICQRERDRIQSGAGIGFSYTGPGAAELVTRLNQLYGIH